MTALVLLKWQDSDINLCLPALMYRETEWMGINTQKYTTALYLLSVFNYLDPLYTNGGIL